MNGLDSYPDVFQTSVSFLLRFHSRSPDRFDGGTLDDSGWLSDQWILDFRRVSNRSGLKTWLGLFFYFSHRNTLDNSGWLSDPWILDVRRVSYRQGLETWLGVIFNFSHRNTFFSDHFGRPESFLQAWSVQRRQWSNGKWEIECSSILSVRLLCRVSVNRIFCYAGQRRWFQAR